MGIGSDRSVTSQKRDKEEVPKKICRLFKEKALAPTGPILMMKTFRSESDFFKARFGRTQCLYQLICEAVTMFNRG